jgi:ProP effector
MNAPTSKKAAKRAAKASARIIARQTIAVLCERFPLAFMPSGAPKIPLKIGIREDIIAACPDLPPDQIAIAMRDYCSGPRYLFSQVTDAVRVGLDGVVVGSVTNDQEDAAMEKMRRYRRLPADVRNAILPKAETLC